MLGEFGVLGRDPVGQPGELTVDRGQFLLGGASLRRPTSLAARRASAWQPPRLAVCAASLQVFVDAAGQMAQPAIENRVLLIGDPLEQVPVVRDDDQRARPGVEQVLGGGEHVGVDVVGGLVEQQHVGLGQQREHELQASSLAAGEFADPRGQLIAGEAESLQQLGGGDLAALDLDSRRAACPARRRSGRRRSRQLIALLIEHRQPDRLAALDAPGVRRDGAGDQSQQGGLPGAVGADDAGAFTRGRSAIRYRAAPGGRRTTPTRRADR